MTHEPHCPVPRAAARGEGAVCLCRSLFPTMPLTEDERMQMIGQIRDWYDELSGYGLYFEKLRDIMGQIHPHDFSKVADRKVRLIYRELARLIYIKRE